MVFKLNEMASERNKVIKRLENYSEIVGSHILKCVVYKNSLNSLKHWIDQELSGYFEIISNDLVKKSIKLKQDDYKKYLFDAYAEDDNDLLTNLKEFRLTRTISHKEYPTFKITQEIFDEFSLTYCRIRDKVVPMFADKLHQYSSEDFAEILHKIINT